MGSSKRATIYDVAAAAGVSITTVSFVLNRPDREPILPRKPNVRNLLLPAHGIQRALGEAKHRRRLVAVQEQLPWSLLSVTLLKPALVLHQSEHSLPVAAAVVCGALLPLGLAPIGYFRPSR